MSVSNWFFRLIYLKFQRVNERDMGLNHFDFTRTLERQGGEQELAKNYTNNKKGIRISAQLCEYQVSQYYFS